MYKRQAVQTAIEDCAQKIAHSTDPTATALLKVQLSRMTISPTMAHTVKKTTPIVTCRTSTVMGTSWTNHQKSHREFTAGRFASSSPSADSAGAL